MIYLNLALYSEGITDDSFLRALLPRIIEPLVAGNRDEPVEVLSIFLVKPHLTTGSIGGDEVLLQAARIACEHDILFVHKDADTQMHKEVLSARFDLGEALIRQAAENGKSVCKHIVPIIPIKMIEAWLLADWQTVLKVIEADISAQSLRAELKKMGLTLPGKPHQAASVRDPKHTLEQIIRIARGRRKITLNSLYEPLGDAIQLEKLDALDDYQLFIADLTAALIALGKIQL